MKSKNSKTSSTFFNLLRNPYFFIAYLSVVVISFLFWDKPLATFFYNHPLTVTENNIVHCINGFGVGLMYVFILPILVFILQRLHKIRAAKQCLFLWVAILFSGLICDILKIVLGRTRPELWLQFPEIHHYGFQWFQLHASSWSFPSGHTTVITTFMMGLSFFKPRYTILWVCAAIVVSSMRLVLFQHHLSDVLAAFYLAAFCTQFLYTFWIKKWGRLA